MGTAVLHCLYRHRGKWVESIGESPGTGVDTRLRIGSSSSRSTAGVSHLHILQQELAVLHGELVDRSTASSTLQEPSLTRGSGTSRSSLLP